MSNLRRWIEGCLGVPTASQQSRNVLLPIIQRLLILHGRAKRSCPWGGGVLAWIMRPAMGVLQAVQCGSLAKGDVSVVRRRVSN